MSESRGTGGADLGLGPLGMHAARTAVGAVSHAVSCACYEQADQDETRSSTSVASCIFKKQEAKNMIRFPFFAQAVKATHHHR
jgi:hypothetical protein